MDEGEHWMTEDVGEEYKRARGIQRTNPGLDDRGH